MAAAKQVSAVKTSKGKDLDAFRSAHDKSFIVPKKIQEGLDALGESWEYEVEFLRRCNTSTTDLAAYRGQFAGYYVEVPLPGRAASNKRVWAGSKKFAAALRAKMG